MGIVSLLWGSALCFCFGFALCTLTRFIKTKTPAKVGKLFA